MLGGADVCATDERSPAEGFILDMGSHVFQRPLHGHQVGLVDMQAVNYLADVLFRLA